MDADDDLGGMLPSRELQKLGDEIGRRNAARRGTQALGELEERVDPCRGRQIGWLAVGAFQRHDHPGRIEARGQSARRSHDLSDRASGPTQTISRSADAQVPSMACCLR